MGREELPAVTRRAIVVDFSRSAHKRISLRALPKFTPYRVKMNGLPFKNFLSFLSFLHLVGSFWLHPVFISVLGHYVSSFEE